jgi:hypothetical protein
LINSRAARVATHAGTINAALICIVVHKEAGRGVGRIDRLVLGLYAVKGVWPLVEEGYLQRGG